MRYLVEYTFRAWGEEVVEADSEEEAIEKLKTDRLAKKLPVVRTFDMLDEHGISIFDRACQTMADRIKGVPGSKERYDALERAAFKITPIELAD